MAEPHPNSDFLNHCRLLLDAALQQALPTAQDDIVTEAMRYSILGEAKRLRPLLVYATGYCLGRTPELLTPLAAAVECVHTYSLIHDDLPCMDDAEQRRGQPSCHRQFDEATAVLAGDALQPLAFELLDGLQVDDTIYRKIVTELARTCGVQGLVRGQMLDLAAEQTDNTVEQMQRIHLLKTARLTEACVLLAALACGEPADSAATTSLRTFARAFGLSFQARDDLLDVIAASDETGKDVGGDVESGKANCALLLGVEPTRRHIDSLRQQAHCALEGFGDRAQLLRLLLQTGTVLGEDFAQGGQK